MDASASWATALVGSSEGATTLAIRSAVARSNPSGNTDRAQESRHCSSGLSSSTMTTRGRGPQGGVPPVQRGRIRRRADRGLGPGASSRLAGPSPPAVRLPVRWRGELGPSRRRTMPATVARSSSWGWKPWRALAAARLTNRATAGTASRSERWILPGAGPGNGAIGQSCSTARPRRRRLVASTVSSGARLQWERTADESAHRSQDMLAVVEHEQPWLRLEQGHDGALRVVDGPPQPQGDGHGIGDGRLGDGGQLHCDHGPARAVPGCHFEGEAGLAHAAGPEQGHERLGTAQAGNRRQLCVATYERLPRARAGTSLPTTAKVTAAGFRPRCAVRERRERATVRAPSPPPAAADGRAPLAAPRRRGRPRRERRPGAGPTPPARARQRRWHRRHRSPCADPRPPGPVRCAGRPRPGAVHRATAARRPALRCRRTPQGHDRRPYAGPPRRERSAACG